MRQIMRTLLAATAVAALSVGSTGCSAMKNGSLASVEPVTSNDRVGSVYLLRGWIGIFSTGIDSLGTQINDEGIHAEVYQETQWSALANAMIAKYENEPEHEPIVLIGHSYGADDVILISRKLAERNIKVDLIVTLDPVTPKKVPGNAELVYNLYQPSAMDNLPFLRGIPLTPDEPGPATLQNVNVRADRPELAEGGVDHFNIEKKPKIHADVIAQVLKVCQPRAEWAAARAAERETIAAATAAGMQITSARVRPAIAEQVAGVAEGAGR